MKKTTATAIGIAAALSLASALEPSFARAQAPSFLAEVNRNQVEPGEVFTYQVTLNVADNQVDNYRAPEFKNLRVVRGSQVPNRQMQMQIGGGGTFIQNTLSWTYQLTPASGAKGVITIAAARVQIDGREMRSNPVNVRVGAGGAPPPAPPAAPGPGAGAPAAPQSSAGGVPQSSSGGVPPMSSAPGGNFIRVVADKHVAFVGEQVTVSWYLYLTQRIDKYDTVTEPRTDTFWTEDMVSVNGRNRLSMTQEMVGDRVYQVALLFKKALFPLRAGHLTISPLESEVAQVDFFGAAVRSQRLKGEPTAIEALPLPAEGQPAGFDPAGTNVGNFTVEARADRPTVAVGEAVTLTVDVKGQGNIRNVRAPKLPKLEGWKSYEPKVTVNVDPGEPGAELRGSKTIEYLLLPERAGTTMIPSFELAFFNPESRSYASAKSEPIRLEVTGDAGGRDRTAAAPGAGAGTPAIPSGAPVENVIAAEIRPIRNSAAPSRDLGATFYRSGFFLAILLIPPLGLMLGSVAVRLRERLGGDTARNQRRRVRRMVRQRLGAAEAHRAAGKTSAFYIEIDRVLRDVLSARLRQPVTGLRMDELRDLLLARGMGADEAARVIGELEACDVARFAPGEGGAGGEGMNLALERAGELMLAIEKAPLRAEAQT